MHFLNEKNLGAENTSPTPKTQDPVPGAQKKEGFGPPWAMPTQPSTAFPSSLVSLPPREAASR